MASEIKLQNDLTKEELYNELLPQINSLIENETNFIANISNVTSALKFSLSGVIWAGFYFIDNEKKDELVLGPFQGKVACTRIKAGQGVCGAAVQRKETVVVDDVEKFPGHIYCDSSSRSEIVVPVIKEGDVKGVLDLDSSDLANFDSTDKEYLEKLVNNIIHLF